MRRLVAAQVSLVVFMLACSGEASSPSTDDMQLARVLSPRLTFGIVAEVSAARAASEEGFFCLLGPAGATFDSRVTIASSGNATLVCRVRTPSGPRPALVIKGEGCAAAGTVTTDMRFVWAPSGQATLVCHVKHPRAAS
jgi:hypothetical protein